MTKAVSAPPFGVLLRWEPDGALGLGALRWLRVHQGEGKAELEPWVVLGTMLPRLLVRHSLHVCSRTVQPVLGGDDFVIYFG